MLHALVARLGTPDVHFLGHVSNEELSALYDVADLFLCASEHEGFCVPIIEAFYKRVPVLAYAATAVPATMDGGGVLYDDEGAGRGRQADGRGADRPGDRGRDRRVAGRGARPTAARRTSPARWCGSSTRRCSIRRVRRRRWRSISGRSSTSSSGSRSSGSTGRPCSRRCPTRMTASSLDRRRHDRQPVGPRGASRRRHRRQRPAGPRHAARGRGHQSEIFALTIDDDLRDDVRPFSEPAARDGDVTIFHFALPSPMTEAFASLRGGRVLQYHNITPARSSPLTIRSCSGWPRSDGRSCGRWSAAWIWRSATRSSTARSSRRWASRRPASCRSPSTPSASPMRRDGPRSRRSSATA